jgi:NAD(P)-dependent dehydrogenase (short-subunit alcohol dehydrogenase family)
MCTASGEYTQPLSGVPVRFPSHRSASTLTDVVRHRRCNELLPPDPVVLVTGCSSGIGLALARQLAAWPEARLLLTARESSLSRLRAAGFEDSERLRMRALDVVDAAQRAGVVAEADADWGGVDVLINNAGITYRSVTEHLQPDEALDQLQTNFLAPMDLVRLVLPSMRRKRVGRIVNVSSVSGMMAMPTMGAYSASKFALEGATESLWYELRPWNIHVTLVQPGFVHSNAFRRVRYAQAARRSEQDEVDEYSVIYRSMGPFIQRLMSLALASPESVARRTLATLDHPQPPLRVSATVDARAFYLLRRWLPRRAYHALLYRALPGVRDWGPRDDE